MIDELAESSGRRLAQRDIAILKVILCQGLYPKFAVADAGNAGRASTEQQYVTRPSGGLFMSPSSVLSCQDFGVVGVRSGGAGGGGGDDGGQGWRGVTSHTRGAGGLASRGAAAEAGRGDGLLCYGQLMETQRPFVSSVTPLPALQALLLFSARVDTSEDASLVRKRGRCFVFLLLELRERVRVARVGGLCVCFPLLFSELRERDRGLGGWSVWFSISSNLRRLL